MKKTGYEMATLATNKKRPVDTLATQESGLNPLQSCSACSFLQAELLESRFDSMQWINIGI